MCNGLLLIREGVGETGGERREVLGGCLRGVVWGDLGGGGAKKEIVEGMR